MLVSCGQVRLNGSLAETERMQERLRHRRSRDKRTHGGLFRSLAFVLWIAGSLLWAAPWGLFFAASWPDHAAPVRSEYFGREQFCKSRYGEPTAQDRCITIMELERFQSFSIMIANRTLVALLPPLIALGALVYLRGRGRAKTGK